MKEKILFVDDEPNVLSSYRRNFYKKYDLFFAESGTDAIELVKADQNITVIVSDYHMPEMNGAKFLSLAHKFSPNSIRILATGAGDINVAIEAINEGSIFRFLQKPFDDTIISKALIDAIRQYKLETIEKSDRLKTEFLQNLSHEIRTPINAITNYTQILDEELYDHMDDDLKLFSKMIKSDSKRLIRTMDLMIDLSSIYSANYDMRFLNVDLIHGIIKPLITQYKLNAENKNLRIEFSSDLEQYNMLLDEYSITQIISNLLDNAIKFTASGKIKIKTKIENDTIFCEFEDNGIGISEEFIPKMFDPFTQEISGSTRPFEGNGLGLALVKELCKLNDFEIEVKSKKDSGSTFTLKLKRYVKN